MLGTTPVSVGWQGSYTDAGATATDTCDGNLTASISVNGSVDTFVPSPYTLTYSVFDAGGNISNTATRIVNVNDTTPPTITPAGNATITVTCHNPSTDPGV